MCTLVKNKLKCYTVVAGKCIKVEISLLNQAKQTLKSRRFFSHTLKVLCYLYPIFFTVEVKTFIFFCRNVKSVSNMHLIPYEIMYFCCYTHYIFNSMEMYLGSKVIYIKLGLVSNFIMNGLPRKQKWRLKK